MTLPEFILANIEPLLDDWTEFARSVPTARRLDLVALRDHAEAMLRVIASDMLTEQSDSQQRTRSEGNAPRATASDSAAEEHGSARRQSGFELIQMVSEFRALRATVIRQWMAATGPAGADAMLDMVRFNEGIDQALAESVVRFVAEVDEAR